MGEERTFTADDIIRIWQNHLDTDEQQSVMCFFCSLCNASDAEELLQEEIVELIIAAASFIPIVGPAFAVLSEAIDLVDAALEIAETLTPCQQGLQALANARLPQGQFLLEGL